MNGTERSPGGQADQKLLGSQELTDEVRAAVEKFLRRQIGSSRGCRGFLGSSSGYPDRADVVEAVEKIWEGLVALYRIDPDANQVEWVSGRPFVSDGDGVWLLGGDIVPATENL